MCVCGRTRACVCGSVDLLRINTYFFCTKDVTRILSVFRWDVNCGEDLDVILIPSTSLNRLFYYKNIGKFRIRLDVLNV